MGRSKQRLDQPWPLGRQGIDDRLRNAPLDLNPAINIARVENAGHMIPWDDLEGFLATFGEFYDHPPTRTQRTV